MKTSKGEETKGKDRILLLPEEERPRERLLQRGATALSNRELLAILIGSGTKGVSAMTVAGEILSMDEKGLLALADITPQELCQISGIGTAKACQVAAAAEIGKRMASSRRKASPSLCSPEDTAGLFMEEMRYLKKESFRVLFLNTKNEVIGSEEISLGSLNSSIVHPREVFSPAVKKSAHALILIHNHPSGNPEPSSNDKEVTKRLKEAGEILGIKVLDHVVIGDGKYFSFLERMLI